MDIVVVATTTCMKKSQEGSTHVGKLEIENSRKFVSHPAQTQTRSWSQTIINSGEMYLYKCYYSYLFLCGKMTQNNSATILL